MWLCSVVCVLSLGLALRSARRLRAVDVYPRHPLRRVWVPFAQESPDCPRVVRRNRFYPSGRVRITPLMSVQGRVRRWGGVRVFVVMERGSWPEGVYLRRSAAESHARARGLFAEVFRLRLWWRP